jgi:hypothetical protein
MSWTLPPLEALTKLPTTTWTVSKRINKQFPRVKTQRKVKWRSSEMHLPLTTKADAVSLWGRLSCSASSPAGHSA